MNFILRREEKMLANTCICGTEPEIIEPNDHYSDCWLKCPKCGLRTRNTGGFHYAEEISVEQARRSAISEWNQLIADKQSEST